MNRKQLRKRAIRQQNSLAARGGHIPKIGEVINKIKAELTKEEK